MRIEAQVFSLVLILISAARSWRSFDPANIGTDLFTGGLGALLVFLTGLYLWMQSELIFP